MVSEVATVWTDAARAIDEALHVGVLCGASLNRALPPEFKRAATGWPNLDPGATLHRRSPQPPRNRSDRFDTHLVGMTGLGGKPGAQGLRYLVVRSEQAEWTVARAGEW